MSAVKLPVWSVGVGVVVFGLSEGWLIGQGMSVPAAIGAGTLLGGAMAVAMRGLVMEADLPGRLRWLLWPQIAGVITVTWMAYLHILPVSPLSFPYMDKVCHFLLFGMVAFFAELWLDDRRWCRLPVSITIPLLLAAGEELAQTLSPHRTADLGDLLCDLAGMCIAWMLARMILTRRDAGPREVVDGPRPPQGVMSA